MPIAQTNDIETFYERRGDGSPIVFIHGAIMDHSQWTPQMEALSTEHTTIAYDVRGHGRTGGSDRDAYTIDLFTEDLDALLRDLGIDRPVICGLSLGGCIAQAYAAVHPDKIAGLVLAGTFTPELSTRGERLQLMALRAAIPLVRLVGYSRVQRVMTRINERFHRGASGNYAEIERLQAAAPKIETDEFAKVIRSLIDFTETDIAFSEISVPTLVLYGENEPSFIRRQAGILVKEIPNASVQEVPDAGHASNIDNPAFFTSALRKFLPRVYPAQSVSSNG